MIPPAEFLLIKDQSPIRLDDYKVDVGLLLQFYRRVDIIFFHRLQGQGLYLPAGLE